MKDAVQHTMSTRHYMTDNNKFSAGCPNLQKNTFRHIVVCVSLDTMLHVLCTCRYNKLDPVVLPICPSDICLSSTSLPDFLENMLSIIPEK